MFKFLRMKEVLKLTGLSRSSILRLENQGKFPKRKRLSDSAVGWDSRDIEKWLDSRAEGDNE